MESHSMSLILIAVCIVMSAYFSASETAFSSLNRIRIKIWRRKEIKRRRLF